MKTPTISRTYDLLCEVWASKKYHNSPKAKWYAAGVTVRSPLAKCLALQEAVNLMLQQAEGRELLLPEVRVLKFERVAEQS